MRRRLSRRLALALAAVLVTSLAACDQQADDEPPPGPVTLRFGVFGSDEEVAAYQAVVDGYNAQAVSTEVELESWPDSAALAAALDAGDAAPDIFLTARRDLRGIVDAGHNAPLFDLLEARDISYGDGYSQTGIEAFSSDDDLQCMPYSVSPMVIYYNTDLIDFEAMRERGLPAPDDELEGWTFEEFEAAAAYATRPRGNVKGVSVEPRLRSLAPFLYSGGGRLFDDDADPTSLALSADENVEPLTTTLELLRGSLTLTPDQLARATPREWFERGKLAMIEGYREITPELREVDGLDFDVMPMPTLGAPATIAEISGLCLAPGERVQQAADFLVHAISDTSVATVARAGHTVPANLTVARSDAFLQPGELPAHAGVFNASAQNIVLLPVIEEGLELDEAVRPLVEEMLNGSVIDPPSLTAEIDEVSRSVLDPDYEPEPSDSSS
ncbi:extracellular solute-binding protein [Nocardioides dongxiaopingii]|uniref:extracellular solute-binding protein n=1 Tax=Nocardioides TaxID=1839 RepID=UPI0010C77073|nr:MULTISPECIES: extracellular solute-binding protein [Nocardioides]QCW51485.1 extracellular solute-binding protein [Nocardioides sp. S-1144]